MSDSDSSDDIPLAQLASSKPKVVPEKAAKPPVEKRKVVEAASDDEEECAARVRSARRRPSRRPRFSVCVDLRRFDVDAAPPPPKKVKKASPPKKAASAPAPAADSESSSDDDDIPLSSLVKAKASKAKAASPAKAKKASAPRKRAPPPPASSSSEEEEDEDDDDDDGDDDDDESDSDDSDVPLAALSKKKKAKAAPAAKKPRRSTSPRPGRSGEASTKKGKPKGGLAEAAFYECQRGQVLQQLLRRWWYAVDWPSEEAKNKPVIDPACWERLEGFPGVHLCWKGDRRGELVDHRDHSTSPCFANYHVKPTQFLKDLCLKACEVQMKQLLEFKPMNLDVAVRDLKKVIADVTRVDCAKADAEAAKAVKAYAAHDHKTG